MKAPQPILIDTSVYLERLWLAKQAPTLDYLKKLHIAHLLNIPFESLDIHYGQKIVLDYERVFEKIVQRGRGGFCYELNGLFYHLLYHLGYDVHIASGRVKKRDAEGYGPEYDHLMVVVDLEGEQWLADIGFGDGFTEPKKIRERKAQVEGAVYWKIDQDQEGDLCLQRSSDDIHYTTEYLFSDEEKSFSEFEDMCRFHQESPDSPFTKRKLITRFTPEGRITLTGEKLKISASGEVHESPISTEEDFLFNLKKYFDITFS